MSTLQFGCAICKNLYIRADEPGYVDIYRKKETKHAVDAGYQSDVDMDESKTMEVDAVQRMLFKFESLPDDLMSIILTKMDQISFARMRRTKKSISSFIQENRRHLKIPLFHNWKATVRGEGITFKNAVISAYEFTLGKNFDGEFDETREIPMTYDNDVKINEDCGNLPMRSEVKVHLQAWKMNEELRHELTGNIRLTSFNISGIKENYQDPWFEFLTSNVHSHVVNIHTIPEKVASHCLKTLAPSSLMLYSSDVITPGYDLETIQKLCIKEAKIRLENKCLKNLETLEFNEPVFGERWFDALDMVRMWCTGESKLKDMFYKVKTDQRMQGQGQGQQPQVQEEQNLGQFLSYGDSLEKHVIEAFTKEGGPLYNMVTKAFSRDVYMHQRPDPEGFCLNQMTSDKKAICLAYGSDILFSVIEKEDQDLFNTPKPEEPEGPADANDADDANDDDAADNDDDANDADDADAADDDDAVDDAGNADHGNQAAAENNVADADEEMDVNEANSPNDADNANDAAH